MVAVVSAGRHRLDGKLLDTVFNAVEREIPCRLARLSPRHLPTTVVPWLGYFLFPLAEDECLNWSSVAPRWLGTRWGASMSTMFTFLAPSGGASEIVLKNSAADDDLRPPPRPGIGCGIAKCFRGRAAGGKHGWP